MRIIRLASKHAVSEFDCAQPQLNAFLHTHAAVNQRRGLGTTYVLLADGQTPDHVIGYYTLSPAQIEKVELPKKVARSLPHYPIPAIRLSRLAVDRAWQGHGLGGLLVAHAMRKSAELSHELGGHLILVDCISAEVVAFYLKFGFEPLPATPLTLYLPMKTAVRLGELALQG